MVTLRATDGALLVETADEVIRVEPWGRDERIPLFVRDGAPDPFSPRPTMPGA